MIKSEYQFRQNKTGDGVVIEQNFSSGTTRT